MAMRTKRSTKLRKTAAQKIKKLRLRVRELEETFLAIRSGGADAVVVNGTEGDLVFTLQGAEHLYRVLVESMNEGAAIVDENGTVLYANASFTEILGLLPEDLIGKPLQTHFSSQERENLTTLIGDGLQRETRGGVSLSNSESQRRLVRLSLSPVHGYGI